MVERAVIAALFSLGEQAGWRIDHLLTRSSDLGRASLCKHPSHPHVHCESCDEVPYTGSKRSTGAISV